MLSQALEESDELVVGSIPTGLSVERCNCIENPLHPNKPAWSRSTHGQAIALSRTARRPVATNPSLLCVEAHAGLRACASAMGRHWLPWRLAWPIVGAHRARSYQTTPACVRKQGLIRQGGSRYVQHAERQRAADQLNCSQRDIVRHGT